MKRASFTTAPDDVREIRHFHLFCGLGGGAKGFNKASPRVGNMVGKFRCIGGVDVNAAAIRDFERLAGVPGTVLDLFDRDQFKDFHGMEPPAGWREATPADIQRAAGNERPHIVFLSAPCKGFSGLLSENRSRSAKYQALNRLTVRGVWLMLEAFADEPPELVVFENVPRIANRGRHLLDQIGDLLRHYGYAVAETTHDCGELGGLAQSRKRFLLVARHIEKVAPFLYEPDKKRLQAVGTVLDRMPLPGDPAGGPMHRVPSLQWKTWVRLAFVEAGSDWRSLNRLRIEDGKLADYLIVPDMHNGAMGVRKWEEPAGVVACASRPMNGSFSIADPRFPAGGEYGQLGVRSWDESTGTVTGQRSPIQGGFSVADPRHVGPEKHSNEFRIVRWDQAAQAVTSAHGTGQCVADPRPGWDRRGNNLTVMEWDKPSRTVIGGGKGVQGGWMSVADPRPNLDRQKGDHYLTAGHYGVVPWDSSTGAVSAAAGHDNGRWNVADPRIELPSADKKLIARIIAEDGTWHRPFTTLELAALQSLVDPEEHLELDGLSDSDWRERIGNAVPPDAAQAIAGVMGTTLLLAWSGETFMLSATPIWVRPVAIALTVARGTPV
ncbi:C-5 cytosine-specific DNA methylase [mine drainage metagenome]|uniref:C-5 cytosine-specific DNA methylase n=1 Tax=mine drainage metagenome TaxID=410659 RepID=A0A1J5S3I0_9ZZZZ